MSIKKYLQNKRILIGITGGIAAYKICELIRALKEYNAEIRTIITEHGKEFITPLTIQTLTGEQPVLDSMGHITIARWADVLLIAPASANFIAKLNAGLADDLLSTTCLATTAPILIAPAMNQQMWQNPATKHNIYQLQNRGMQIIGPGIGNQACGENGPGRMLEPTEILEHLDKHFAPKILTGKHILITAGPTQEAIDPVRFISNHSSGKMGYELANAALKLGANVTLISGPTNLAAPHNQNLTFVAVISAQEMLDTVLHTIQTAKNQVHTFISCAAVADYAPKNIYEHKLKKHTTSINLELQKTTDILQTVASMHNNIRPYTIGFAAETENLVENAQKKLESKCLDMIIANYVGNDKGFNQENNEVLIIDKTGNIKALPLQSKSTLAYAILENIQM